MYIIDIERLDDNEKREFIEYEIGWYNLFYTFSHFKRPFYRAKNKKKCKINSRNFTYDSLTFSFSVFILEEVKDEI